jgi:hypothetical protein
MTVAFWRFGTKNLPKALNDGAQLLPTYLLLYSFFIV